MGRSTEITGLKGRERLAEALREQSYPVLCLCWGGVGLVLSMARILGENAPFGVALAAAVPFPLVLPSAVGGILGYLLGGGMGESFPLVGALLLTAVTRWVVGPRWEKHRAWTSPLLAGGMVFLAGVVPLLYGSPLFYDVVMWVTQVVMGAASASFLERGASAILRKGPPADRLDSTALCIMGALLLMGLDSASVGGVTLGRIAAVMAVLCAARMGNEGLSSIVGMVCGLAVGFATGDFPPAITVYGLGGMLAGIFSAFGRTGSTLAFLFTYGAISAMTEGSVSGFIEVALGSFLFLMIPLPWFRLGSALVRPAAADEQAVKLVVEERLQSAAAALRDVSQTTRDVARRLGDLSGGDLSSIYDRVVTVSTQEAYAAARLRAVLGARPEKIRAEVSGNIIKNVKSVIVPNTGGLKGIRAAVAACVVAGDPDRILQVISHVPAQLHPDIAAYAQKGTAGRYVSERIPFAYDYCHRDGDVSAASGHGTHVAALAAGYARREDGTVRIRGGAPGAQILAMKIFPDEPGGGADDAVILRALEDAWNLGADVINLSVGTGPGFSRDGALDGAYYRAFALLASEGVIVCCSAGNEESAAVYKTWARPLPSGAYPDYGSVTAPASFRGAVSIAAAGEEEGRAVMADYSSWGPASGLHLAPALTAFGGPVVSAGAGEPEAYRSDYGTSMACGYASGLFAAALQALEERGVTDRKEAARLAQALLESTARTLADEGGAPLSPRKQGAGLMDLDAALASPAAFLNPLAELGDREDGRFTLRYTLKNLSDQAADYALTVRVLTDAYTEDGGTACSLMSPLDITEGVSVAGPASVSVPAGGEAEIVFELAIRDGLRRELAEAYPNGFYVEGYVTAAGAESGPAVHGTFLGFCGDWEAAPVLEAADFRDLQEESFRLAGEGHGPAEYNPLQVPEPCLEGLGAELGANLAYLPARGTADSWYGRLLGANGHAAGACSEARFAIPGWDSDGMYSLDRRLCLTLYALRNAAGIAAAVWEAAGHEQ